MDEYIQISAKNKDEAIIKASIELGTSSDQLDIIVVSEGSSGFFGIGSRPAIIKAKRKAGIDTVEEDIMESIKLVSEKPEEPKPVKKEKEPVKQEKKKEQPKREVKKEAVKKEKESVKEPKPEKAKEKPVKEKTAKEKPAKEKPNKEKPSKAAKPIEPLTDPAEIAEIEQRAVEFLKGVFGAMNLNVEIRAKYNGQDGCLEVDFEGDDMGILIGKKRTDPGFSAVSHQPCGEQEEIQLYPGEAGYRGLPEKKKRNSGKPCKRNCLQSKEDQKTCSFGAYESV